MAREHLFRGKRLDNAEWVEGSLVRQTMWYGDPIKERDYIFCGGELDGDYYDEALVDPDTVGEYTDLKDSTGRKVFEGDILRFKDVHSGCEWIGRVEFGNPNGKYDWGFQLVFISGKKPNTDILLWFDMEEAGVSAEIIGNLWDNPELMETEG